MAEVLPQRFEFMGALSRLLEDPRSLSAHELGTLSHVIKAATASPDAAVAGDVSATAAAILAVMDAGADVQEMEAEFNKEVGSKIEDFQAKLQETQTKLQNLQAQKAQGSELFLSPEQEAEIAKLREQQVDYARLTRELQKDLRRQKDKLAGKITLLNVAAMPALVILFGLALFLKRRSSTRAR